MKWLPMLMMLATTHAAQAAEPRVAGKGHAMQVHKPVDLKAADAAARGREAALQQNDAKIRLLDVLPYGAGVVEHWQLGNGLQVVLAVDAQVPVVAVQSWLRVGSADEIAGKTGLAHLFEHMMFKSTEARPAGTLDRVLEQMGGSANAATSLDYTFFQETVPSGHVPTVLAMEADRLVNLDLTAAAFRSELSVVRNERREVVDNDPDGQIDEIMSELAWGAHPYGHPVIGTEKDLAALTVADARQFYQTHYAAGHTLLVLVGGFDPAALLREVVQHYGKLPQGSPPQRPNAALPTGPAQRALAIDAGAERLAMAWRLPPGDHSDMAALDVLTEMLANGDSTRLARALLYEKPIASHASADLNDARLGSLLQIHVTLLPGQLAKEALARVDAAIRALNGSQPMTDGELLAAKNRLKMAHFSALTSVDGRAEQLGHFLTGYGSLQPLLRFSADVEAVTVADVQRVAHKYLAADRRIVVLGEMAPPKVAGRRRAARPKG